VNSISYFRFMSAVCDHATRNTHLSVTRSSVDVTSSTDQNTGAPSRVCMDRTFGTVTAIAVISDTEPHLSFPKAHDFKTHILT